MQKLGIVYSISRISRCLCSKNPDDYIYIYIFIENDSFRVVSYSLLAKYLLGYIVRQAMQYHHYSHMIPSSESRKTILWVKFLMDVVRLCYHHHSIIVNCGYQRLCSMKIIHNHIWAWRVRGDCLQSVPLLIVCLWLLWKMKAHVTRYNESTS